MAEWRQAFHLEPPRGWLNDPNGLCWFGGRYHVYFQYCPLAADGSGPKCWGHYESPDLLHWTFTGVPLTPDHPRDADGVYSGSAAADGGTLRLYYTGNVKHPGDYDYVTAGREGNTLCVETADGRTMGQKRLLLTNGDYPADCSCHVRDPKVWRTALGWRMVLGARSRSDAGRVLLYRSADGLRWQLEAVLEQKPAFGYMWECPDYFELDGQGFLSLSPQGLPHGTYTCQNVYQSGHFAVDGDLAEGRLYSFAEWDMGFDFYAPQTFRAPDGRRILIGWMGIPDADYANPTTALGWQHCLTVPRQVTLQNGRLCQTPVRELDALSFGFALLVPCVGALNVIYALGYMSHSHSQWRFYCSFTAMCGGLVGMAAAPTLFSFFLFWEIMSSWTLYMAIAHEGDKDSLREAFKYFCFNVCGAGFIFVGVCFLGGNLAMSARPTEIAAAISTLQWHNAGAPFVLGFCLVGVGFLMKAAQLPFRIDWQMHPAVAPTPVSGFISSVLLKSSIFGLVKLFLLLGGSALAAHLMSGEALDRMRLAAMWIGGITIVYAALQALVANQVKLVFIYSTVSQIGYMVLAVAAGGSLGYAGGLLHVVNHVFFKDLLFLVCGAVMFASHCETLEDLGGLGRRMPFTLAMFAIAGLSVVGVPPTSGFSSKWLIYHGLMQAGQPLLALLSLVGSVITLAYVAKFLHAAFLGQPAPHLERIAEVPFIMRLPMGILAVGCVLTGIFPGLALWPINVVLLEYGLAPLPVSPAGIAVGPGAWNATGMAVMMALAVGGGMLFVKRFVRLREIDVHTCGLPPETATSRMKPASIYGGLVRLLGHLPGAPDPAQGERGSKEHEA